MNSAAPRGNFLERELRVRKRPALEDPAYIPLPLEVLLPGERLTFPLFLKVSRSWELQVEYAPCLEEGEELQASWMEKLRGLGLCHLYVHKRDLAKVVAYLNNHLLVQAIEPEPTPQEFVLLREHLHFSLRLTLESPQLMKTTAPARKTLGTLVRIFERKPRFLKLMWDLLYQEYTLYTHSVNVAVLGVAFMAFLKRPAREGLTLGLAGLLHDVGLTRISPELLQKPEPLTPEEWEVIRKHPCLGYRLLRGNAALPLHTVRLVLEHHELADGSGYPQGLPLHKQHPLSRHLALLEAYDGMTLFRPYRPRLRPFDALNTLREQQGKRGPVYDSQVLKRFIEMMALG